MSKPRPNETRESFDVRRTAELTKASLRGAISAQGMAELNRLTTPANRTFVYVNTTEGDATLTSANGPNAFQPSSDVGALITGQGIPDGATLVAVVSDREAVLSVPATASSTKTRLVKERIY